MSNAENHLRIDYIEFAAENIPKVKAFYTGVFGWKFEDWGPEYIAFHDGRLAGGFRLGTVIPRTGPLVVLYATELEPVEAKVKQHGGSISKQIFEFPGGKRFHFTDPSGNELAVWTE